MKLTKRNPEDIERKCNLLESYGFEILHDTRVKILDFSFLKTGFDDPLNKREVRQEAIEVDFSAIDEKKYIEHAIKQAYLKGREAGVKELQDGLNNLLGNPKKEEEY